MSTAGERAVYYQRVVAAADAAKVPVSAVYGKLTDFADLLEPATCIDCGRPISGYHGRVLCDEHLLERKRHRDRERMRFKRLLAGDREIFPVDSPVLCADCGETHPSGFLHVVVLVAFCEVHGLEIIAMRQNKGLSWDR